jgi:hypothetical protein
MNTGGPPPHFRRRIMTRKKLILVAGTCAVAVAIGSPAYALNPQPLPPGRTATPTHVFYATGTHFHR